MVSIENVDLTGVRKGDDQGIALLQQKGIFFLKTPRKIWLLVECIDWPVDLYPFKFGKLCLVNPLDFGL